MIKITMNQMILFLSITLFAVNGVCGIIVSSNNSNLTTVNESLISSQLHLSNLNKALQASSHSSHPQLPTKE